MKEDQHEPDETVTGASDALLFDPAFVVPSEQRADVVPDETPNGLFAGPNDEPDRFELIGTGLRGGEGITWRGRYRGSLGHPVVYAIKQLLRPPQAPPSWPTAADVQRWTDLRHLLQTIQHRHLVVVNDLFFGPEPHRAGTHPAIPGRTFSVPYLVMEWVDGPTLTACMPGTAPDLAQRLSYVRDLADAVTALHSLTWTSGNPLLHRDIKPDNCIIQPERGLVLVDLGTLRRVDDGYDPYGMHTRHYAAPEVLADPHTPRSTQSDLYALGAVAYFCVVGTHPPVPDEIDATATMRTELSRACTEYQVRAPEQFVDHILRMLSADPRQRPSRSLPWAEEALSLALPATPSAPGGRLRRRWSVIAAAIVLTALVPIGVKIFASGHGGGPTTPAQMTGFQPFGNEYIRFPAQVKGDSITLSPPTDEHRYDHLWGVLSSAEACATRVEFDARVTTPHPEYGYGYAIAPRSLLGDDNVPHGYSIQYEWQATDINATAPGSYLRPAQLPGGAWEGTIDPARAPDITKSHHVIVSSVGTTLEMDVDGTRVSYQIPAAECGGVAIRAWGAPVEFTHMEITKS